MEQIALVLAGGEGTRLFPASQSDHPKQFLKLFDETSLLENTLNRLSFVDTTYIITQERYTQKIQDITDTANIIIEPAAKNTGPAMIYGAHEIAKNHGNPCVLATPSDHYISGEFASTANNAMRTAQATDGLVTIGVEPTRPETEYGYIEPNEKIDDYYSVSTFHEKPPLERAKQYIDADYQWNSGIFAWQPETLLQAASRSEPMKSFVKRLESDSPGKAFDKISPISIDEAVFEIATNVYMVSASFEWDDVGTWDALERILDGDNTILGNAETIDASGNILASDTHQINVIGVDDLIIAAYNDHVLVLPKHESRRVRELVNRLSE
ncbi:MAG: mannose-1-phosphate guanylyltransferase [Halobacteriaceae archaeon]